MPQTKEAPAPICTGCRYYKAEAEMRKMESAHRCTHVQCADTVTGDNIDCRTARAKITLCGPEGRWFERPEFAADEYVAGRLFVEGPQPNKKALSAPQRRAAAAAESRYVQQVEAWLLPAVRSFVASLRKCGVCPPLPRVDQVSDAGGKKPLPREELIRILKMVFGPHAMRIVAQGPASVSVPAECRESPPSARHISREEILHAVYRSQGPDALAALLLSPDAAPAQPPNTRKKAHRKARTANLGRSSVSPKKRQSTARRAA